MALILRNCSLEEAQSIGRRGHMFDDDGEMRFVEYSSLDKELRVAFLQATVCVDIGDVHASASGDESLGHGQADAASASGDKDAL